MSTNGFNRWSVGYSAICFFERILSSHNKVASFTRTFDIRFDIIRVSSLSPVSAVITNEYVLGEASLYAIIDEFPKIDAIVNVGSWNQIAIDWRLVAQQTDVMVLETSNFFGALHAKRIADYIPSSERQERNNRGRKSS